jgi:hypothetical protein
VCLDTKGSQLQRRRPGCLPVSRPDADAERAAAGVTSSRSSNASRPNESAACRAKISGARVAGARRLWRPNAKGGLCSEVAFRCGQVRDQLHLAHAASAGSRAAGVAGEPLRTTSGRRMAGDLGSEGSPGRRCSPGGQVKDDFSAPRLRQSAHAAPAGGARRDRSPPSAPRVVRATRGRAPALPGSAERHAALPPAAATDRRCAADGAEARRMDARAQAIGPSRLGARARAAVEYAFSIDRTAVPDVLHGDRCRLALLAQSGTHSALPQPPLRAMPGRAPCSWVRVAAQPRRHESRFPRRPSGAR